MSLAFRDGVPELCGIACSLLNWSPNEFWQSTPSELAMALFRPETETDEAPSREVIMKMLERENDG
ncbi:MAG: phage tail assembly chaperone [Erythrobacter sp.]